MKDVPSRRPQTSNANGNTSAKSKACREFLLVGVVDGKEGQVHGPLPSRTKWTGGAAEDAQDGSEGMTFHLKDRQDGTEAVEERTRGRATENPPECFLKPAAGVVLRDEKKLVAMS